MKNKKLAIIVCVLMVACVLFGGCDYAFDKMFNIKEYHEAEVGEAYNLTFDSKDIKLPKNYIFFGLSFSESLLCKIEDDQLYSDWEMDDVHPMECPILEGRYVFITYTEDYAILCEEVEARNLKYLSLEFDTQAVEYYDELETIYENFGEELDWYTGTATFDSLTEVSSPEEYYAEYDRKDKEGLR